MNASKDVFGYMFALLLKAVKPQHSIRKLFCGSFAPLVQRLQTQFMQKVAAVSKAVNDSGREILIKLCGSTSEFEAATKGRLERLVGGNLASPGIGAAVPEAGGSSGESGASPSKKCLL